MAEHNLLGQSGEDFARHYLEQQGYTIRDVNWHAGSLELDIVAENENFLVIVEVKTRTTAGFGHPADAVDNTKIRRLVRAADVYIQKYGIDKETRFDIIALVQHGQGFDLEHIEDAFLPPIG